MSKEDKSFFSRLTSFVSNRKVKKQELEHLYQLMKAAVSDGYVSSQEIERICEYFGKTGLTDDEYQNIAARIFEEILAAYVSDRRLTEPEKQALYQIGIQLGIPQALVSKGIEQNSLFSLLHDLETAPFDELPAMRDSGIILQSGEIDYVTYSASLLEERVIDRQIVGRSSGMSFRIMKGVTYRVGQSRGRLVSQTGIVPVSSGKFTITNKRLVFSGDRKSVNAPLSKILDIDMFTDGIRFSLTNRQRPVIVGLFSQSSAEVSGVYFSRILNS